MAAANLIDHVGDALVRAMGEYHTEIVTLDARREQDAVIALAERIRKDAEDDQAVNQHVRAFSDALAKLRADTQTEYTRYSTSVDNVKTLREVARSLREVAIASLSLEDETKRYLTDALVQLRQNVNRAPPDDQTPTP